MNLWKLLLLMNLPRAPGEASGGGNDPVVDPAVDPAADPAVDPAADPAVADPAADPAVADPAPHGNKGKTPWWMNRINEETNAKRKLADENATLKKMLEAKEPVVDPAAPAPRAAPAARSDEDINQLVEQRASQKRLYDDTSDIRDMGLKEFPDFGNTVQVLQALGATTDEFMADIVAVDKANAHKILDKLAKDPEKTASLVSMDPRRRTAELTRLSMAEGAKPAAAAAPAVPAVAISKAPKPAASIAAAAGAAETDGLGDEVDDATFSKNWDKKFLKRA